MSLIQSQYFCFRNKFSIHKNEAIKLPLLSNNEENYFQRNKNIKRVFHRSRESYGIPCRVHRRQWPLMEESGDDYGGIGIIEFFRGKNIFITGATGFLGKGDELWLLMRSSRDQSVDVTKYLKKLGLERAELYGWHNAYQMTKAMGEMVINEIKGDVPTLIIRPSIIESCYQDPFPGWIQGFRVADPVILCFGKGQLPAYLADPLTTLDIVPMDMVTNTTIAAIAKHGNSEKPELNVYHVASGDINPLQLGHFFEIIHEYFVSKPLVNSKSENNVIKKVEFFNNMKEFSEYTQSEIWEHHIRLRNGAVETDEKTVEKQCKARIAYALKLCKIYEFTGFMKSRFHTGNIRKLLREMSEEEQLSFGIDMAKIDWRKYLQEIHIPGLIKHVPNIERQGPGVLMS